MTSEQWKIRIKKFAVRTIKFVDVLLTERQFERRRMMKRTKSLIGFCLLLLAMACLVFGQEKKSQEGSISGTWDCIAHLSGENDIPFTMNLVQQGESVTGSLSTGDGELEIKTGTFKDNLLDLHLESSDAKYVVNGKLDGGQFKGHWSKDGDGLEGDWEGKKSAPTKPSGQS